MLSISTRVTVSQRIRLIASSLLQQRSIGAATAIHSRYAVRLNNPKHNLVPRRNYIFFPSTIDDMLKLIKSQTNERGRIMVKLSTRWHDQLGTVLDRYDKLLRQASSRIMSNVKSQHTNLSSSKTMNRYNSLKSWGMARLLTHYNAKKRVFARRRKTFKSLRRMNATEAKLYRDQYFNAKKIRLRQGLARLRMKVERRRELVREWLMNTGRPKQLRSLAAADTNKPSSRDNAKATWRSLTLTEPSQQSWFDAEGYPLTSREETGRFVNPWQSESTNGENGLRKFFRWKTEKLMKKLGFDVAQQDSLVTRTNELNKKSVYREDTWPYIPSAPFAARSEQTIKLAWLGHATTLVSMPGNFSLLTDPHFSNYAGPMKRNDPPPINVVDLPNLDCVMISHDHMDHLDYWSILELVDSNKVTFWIVPIGIKEWLINKAGICPDDIIELEWWEGVSLSKESCDQSAKVEKLVRAFDKSNGQTARRTEPTHGNKNELLITCAPAQHWCSRSPFDRNRRLWCSYAVHATPSAMEDTGTIPQTHAFYFAGDTGLPPEFPLHHQIGDRLGPFDLAAIPIGAYEPRWFMKESHCDPAEAVEIHQALRSHKSVAIHFDTFNLADEPQAEPPLLLVEEVERINENIIRLAAEVVAVTDEVNVVVGREPTNTVSNSDIGSKIMKDVQPTQSISTLEESAKLIEVLPPLVDFAVIKQGHYIESAPKN